MSDQTKFFLLCIAGGLALGALLTLATMLTP